MRSKYVSYGESLIRRKAVAKKELSRLNNIYLNSDVDIDISKEVEACLEELDVVNDLIKSHDEFLKTKPVKD